jgi:5-methyltetrahydropteroyltriglutamate--homocysteine methyltransferase
VKRSIDRVLTTHCGSLPRSDDLVEIVSAAERRKSYDRSAFAAAVRRATAETVRRQVDAGLDVVNDGEQGKFSFTSYYQDRFSGLEMRDAAVGPVVAAEAADFPGYFAHWPYLSGRRGMRRQVCTGPISYVGADAVRRDIAWLGEAAADNAIEETFMTAISPATVVRGLPNEYYASKEEFEVAVADALSVEYKAIVDAGILLQIDCPDFGVTARYSGATSAEHRIQVARNVELLNHATRAISPEQMRFHVCWGADEAPHHRDIPLSDMVDLLLQARPQGMTLVGANGRHEWEWQVWQDTALPDGKVIIAGVIDSTTNIIEHPETVADRVMRYARVLGRENVMAGVDCGLDTVAGVHQVDPDIAWAKLAALSQGARLASGRLWS